MAETERSGPIPSFRGVNRAAFVDDTSYLEDPRFGEDHIDRINRSVRAQARALLAEHNVSQAQVAKLLGISQSGVSHMLNDRQLEMTPVEIWWVERLCGVRPGHIYERVGLVERRTVEQMIWEHPELDEQAAEAVIGAFQAALAQRRRKMGGRS